MSGFPDKTSDAGRLAKGTMRKNLIMACQLLRCAGMRCLLTRRQKPLLFR
jgi:hypothetical protein